MIWNAIDLERKLRGKQFWRKKKLITKKNHKISKKTHTLTKIRDQSAKTIELQLLFNGDIQPDLSGDSNSRRTNRKPLWMQITLRKWCKTALRKGIGDTPNGIECAACSQSSDYLRRYPWLIPWFNRTLSYRWASTWYELSFLRGLCWQGVFLRGMCDITNSVESTIQR